MNHWNAVIIIMFIHGSNFDELYLERKKEWERETKIELVIAQLLKFFFLPADAVFELLAYSTSHKILIM